MTAGQEPELGDNARRVREKGMYIKTRSRLVHRDIVVPWLETTILSFRAEIWSYLMDEDRGFQVTPWSFEVTSGIFLI